MEKNTVFFIVGPTACGKTDAAVSAALALDGEVVSADSIQIYRGLDRGSAKPTEEEKRGVVHHMIDIVGWEEEDYNVARFARDAAECIEEIASRGKTPIVAGGTGLYVNSLLYPLDFTSVLPDPGLRERLTEEEAASPGCLYERLKEADPAAAERLHPNDLKRIVRALEVFESSGVSLTDHGGDFLNEKEREIGFEPVIAGVAMDRARLYERINKRVDIMLENGLEEEARALWLASGKKPPLALQAIGYKQFIAYFEGKAGYDETVELIKRETRRFAKRQISWFKRDKRIRWFDADKVTKAELHQEIISYFKEERERIERSDKA